MGYIASGAISRGTTFGAQAQTTAFTSRTRVTRPTLIVRQPVKQPVYGGTGRIVAKAPPLPTSWRELTAPRSLTSATGRVTPVVPTSTVAPSRGGGITVLTAGGTTRPVKRPPISILTPATSKPTRRPPITVLQPAPTKPSRTKSPSMAEEVENLLDQAEASDSPSAGSGASSGGGGGGGTWWPEQELIDDNGADVISPEVVPQDAQGGKGTTLMILGGAALAAAYAIWGM
jgi:hypothetical protein